MSLAAAHDEQTPAASKSRRSPVPAGRWIVRAVVAMASLAAGWTIVVNTMADTRAQRDPEAALGYRPGSAAALVALAEDRLSEAPSGEADLAAIAGLARRALAADPLAPGVLRVLALTEDFAGRRDHARALMRLAADRSGRDIGAWLWLFDDASRTGNVAGMLTATDVILRSAPAIIDTLYPVLMVAVETPDGQGALTQALAANPPWRGPFLRKLSLDAGAAQVAYATFVGLAATAAPPQTGELGPYLNGLVNRGEYLVAFLTWIRSLPPEQSKDLPFVFNGDFELPISGLAFDWAFGDVRGAATEVVATGDKAAGKALRVVFSDTRVPYRHASKLLYLPPGSYELSGMVKAESLQTARGMRWRVTCVGARMPIAESDAFKGTFAWRPFAVGFTVPDGCPALSLRLELDTRVVSEQQISGTFWTDALIARRTDITAAAN